MIAQQGAYYKNSAKYSNFVDLLQDRADAQPDKICYSFLSDGETQTARLTYNVLNHRAQAIAACLQERKIQGTRALLIYPPGLDFIAAFMGCLYSGITAVPAYPPRRNQKISRLKAIVNDAQAELILTTAALLPVLHSQFESESMTTALDWVATDTVNEAQSSQWQRPSLTGETLAFLQYTSGSTGSPKGVMVTHENLIQSSYAINECFQDTPASCGLSWLPPYHDMGLIGGILQPLYVGASMILMSPASFIKKPVRWLQAISKYQITTSGGPNFAYDLLCRKVTPEQRSRLDLSHWSVAFSGAEPVRVQTLQTFTETFAECGFRAAALYPCYGMAEATLLITGGAKSSPPIIRYCQTSALEQNNEVILTASHDSLGRSIVGCGQASFNHEVVIVDPQTLTVCEDGHVGEIWVSGPSIAQGYWQNPQATKRTFEATLEGRTEAFLRTGDLGFLEAGELFVTGRLKDLIIICGRNHYPQDIEATVEQSHPALRPGCGAAFAVEVQDKEKLVIVQEVERTSRRHLDVKEIVQAINQAVSEQHELQVYAVLLLRTGALPKTSSGKVRRHACQEGFLNQSLSVIADWSATPLGKTAFQKLTTDVDSLLHTMQTMSVSTNRVFPPPIDPAPTSVV